MCIEYRCVQNCDCGWSGEEISGSDGSGSDDDGEDEVGADGEKRRRRRGMTFCLFTACERNDNITDFFHITLIVL